MSRIIKNCRRKKGRSRKKIGYFRSKLGFKLHDITISKEGPVTTKTIKTFLIQKTIPRHFVLSYQIDLYFPENKLAIEVDEKGYIERDENKEIERQEEIKKELGCEIHKIHNR